MEIGITTHRANTQLEKFGFNKLPEKKITILGTIILRQLKNFLIVLLAIACILSLIIGNYINALLIFLTLVVNCFLGVWQEYKASKEIAALRKLEVLTARVVRDGKEKEISAYEIVPDDVVILESGDKIPADGMLIEAYGISVNESSLTGESLSVVKTLDEDTKLYFGTTVIEGRAKMRVTETGKNTRFGKIAMTLEKIEEKPTFFDKELRVLEKKVAIIAAGLAILIFGIQLIQDNPIFDAFLASVALIVAIVPEGLPTVITVLLAIGITRLYRKKTLVRKMVTIENLGATNIICTDKTGTLTKNEMRVKEFLLDKKDIPNAIKASILCNTASLALQEGKNDFTILGDTTEGALLLWARQQGGDIEAMRQKGTIIEEISFDLKKRMMAVLWKEDKTNTLYAKGAPEAILPLCTLSHKEQEKVRQMYEAMASKGLRVLAIAFSHHAFSPLHEALQKLTYIGLVGIADEPREETAGAIAKARRAGIEVVMITGDNELTARAIGSEIGLLQEKDEIITGEELAKLSDEELAMQLGHIRIFARVIPEQKLQIVQAYQKLGKVVAVTGDGVNDALALKQADVGIAMGTGTDVAKESADIVILNDNLATIIAAIEQGRIMYSNMVTFVRFLMAGNLSEMLVIVGCALFGVPNVLFPIQILWINFVTDGLPALSLTADPTRKHIMDMPPRKATESLMNSGTLRVIFGYGALIALVNIGLFVNTYHLFGNIHLARSVVFTSIVVTQMLFVFVLRKHQSFFSNKYLLLSVGLVLLMQVLILVFEPLRFLFELQ